MGDVRGLWIEGPAGRIEAAYRSASPPRAAAVVAHPHPLHGGTLHNPVIFHSDRELNRLGIATLRFNFRGVGTSEGTHDDGRGEVEDLAAAFHWLRGVVSDVPLLVVGYSFGSWCGARFALDDGRVAGLIAIGLPVTRYDMSVLGRWTQPLAVVQGSLDEFGDEDQLREFVHTAGVEADLRIVPDAEHLFPGRVRDAAAAVSDAGTAMLERLGV